MIKKLFYKFNLIFFFFFSIFLFVVLLVLSSRKKLEESEIQVEALKTSLKEKDVILKEIDGKRIIFLHEI